MIGDNEYHTTSKTSPSNLCFRTLILKVSSKKHLFFCSLIVLRRCLKSRDNELIGSFLLPIHLIKSNRRFLYYFSVYVNLFKELFLLLLSVTCQVACFAKRVQRYRENPFLPNVLKIIFSRNELFYLKLTQIN